MKRVSADGDNVDMGAPAERKAAPLRRTSGASEEDAGAASGGGAALDSSQVKAPSKVRGHIARRQRWKRRHTSAKFLRPLAATVPTEAGEVLRPVRVARCSWTLGQTVGVMHDGARPAGYAGLERCSSIWACPHCSATIRAGRAAEIEQAVTAHQATGGSVVFFTGTVRHHAGDALTDTLGQVLDSWSRLRRNKSWRTMKSRYGIAHYIRSIEVTGNFSAEGHGWHPHCHSLLFLDGDITEEQLQALRADLFHYWTSAVEALGGKKPTEKGLDLQKCDKKGKVLARYVGKIQEKKRWTAGAELARFDAKSGRGESISPFELLDDDSSISPGRRAVLWREYYSATKGRRAITWSRGLKKLYEIGEKDDEEILDDAESTVLVWRTPARVFRAVRRENVENLAVALELAEAEDWDKLNDILPGRRAKARSAPPPNRV